MVIITVTFQMSCSEDDTPQNDEDVIVEEPNDNQEGTDNEDSEIILEGVVEIIKSDQIDDNYVLVNDAAAGRAFIMDKQARLVYEWPLTNRLGNDVFLLPNGELLACLKPSNPFMNLGGQGGILQLVAPDGFVNWEFEYSSSEKETHHDAELLPNGNILAMVWERISAETAVEAGFMLNEDVFPETIIEIDPATNEIVWEWRSWDHIIQNHDANKANFGQIADHPELIDINYVPNSDSSIEIKGDIMHANGIAYDEENDVILLSVNFFSEVWAIDHSTTTEEARDHSGGNYGKGGDLIYRFGNPQAYGNTVGERLFYNNHFPNLLKGENQGKMLVFSNGKGFEQSTVYELELPQAYNLQANTNNELNVTWSFTDPELYSLKVSGAVPLPNGNILITEGDFGLWEVSRENEVVWKCNIQGFIWRGYSYSKDGPEMQAIGL
ncbi:MAG: aryl-sulfate sulfotransferase [Croceitalea sp.]|nr:aryl-sulfate sulfotransferase [Croceitalea sp.]